MDVSTVIHGTWTDFALSCNGLYEFMAAIFASGTRFIQLTYVKYRTMSEATGVVLTPMPKGELKDQETSWKNVSISATMRTVIKQMLGREKTLHLNNPMLNFIKSEEYKKIIVRRCG